MGDTNNFSVAVSTKVKALRPNRLLRACGGCFASRESQIMQELAMLFLASKTEPSSSSRYLTRCHVLMRWGTKITQEVEAVLPSDKFVAVIIHGHP